MDDLAGYLRTRRSRVDPAAVGIPVERRRRVDGLRREEVAHLARLARIELTDDELDHLAPQLDQIITLVGQVSQVAADDIPPTSHALPLTNVMRADENVPCLTPEQALSGAPAAEEQRFRVPRILEED